ncbi:MAG: hypothetical protein FJ292_06380 [Planctomycetes bacterium]|nr:hypothetical protein [Planctomycetota bacterium]
MRRLCAITSLALIGCGLGLTNSATADVVLLTQERSAMAFNGTTTRSSTAAGFSDFSANRLFHQSGTNGYWNGASQYQLGVGFAVPSPSALCMVALSAFLRRRRT